LDKNFLIKVIKEGNMGLSKNDLLVLEWIENEPGIRIRELLSRQEYGVVTQDIRNSVWNLLDSGIVNWNEEFRLYVGQVAI